MSHCSDKIIVSVMMCVIALLYDTVNCHFCFNSNYMKYKMKPTGTKTEFCPQCVALIILYG